ncbi:CBS domain-containing protein [Methylobacterium radiodurans]|uniref:Signal transduction protein n=1 Tax=Methylobacterium radiodurans TaxID=2202828 RepID=A0A2U8VVE5_9HYPH|nr:CBS domain-containing protein [Methylobacterium radiodurans]AWN37707.1 signal transduction protein [Methylobacterium radiodurans]
MTARTVSDLLAGRTLRSIGASFTVAAACHRMREHGVGALAVLDDGKLVGILSERDIAVRVIAGHRDPMLTLVREVMTPRPRTVPAHEPIPAALRAMMHGRFRHLPVLSDGEPVGMLSLRDIPAEYRTEGEPPRHRSVVPALG